MILSPKLGFSRVSAVAMLFYLVPGPLWPVGFANRYELSHGTIRPAPPTDLTDSLRPLEWPDYYLVQLRGPVRRQWLDQLRAAGARPVGYLPPEVVVVALAHDVRAELLRLPFVSQFDRFPMVAKLDSILLAGDTVVPVAVAVFQGHSPDSLARLVAGQGIQVVRCFDSGLLIRADRNQCVMLARLSAVRWLEPATEALPCNDNVQWVVQTGWQPVVPPGPAGRRLWQKGLRGQGMLLANSDYGLNLDHEMLANPWLPVRAPGVYLNHHKIAAYKLFNSTCSFSGDDTAYHGTRTTATAAGNDSINGDWSALDGLAPEARICFMDVGASYPTLRYVPIAADLGALYDSIYAAVGPQLPVRQATQSWGFDVPGNRYQLGEALLDDLCWRHPDFVVVCAAANDPAHLWHPALAKNMLSVGGCGNGIQANSFYYGGSRGPARDGRYKPDLVAPAIDIWSAAGAGARDYNARTGTSMAAPAVCAACALIRQYLNEGWYPDGEPDPGRALSNPSSALIRAMAIISADPNVDTFVVPNGMTGWGRLDLDSVLYFREDERRLVLFDEPRGLATGETREYLLDVDRSIPLRTALAWTDTAGAPNAETALVNNLDLELFSPDGQRYRGNKFMPDGQSLPGPAGWDSVNNIECFRLNSPSVGRWRLVISAPSVFTASQPYALVITGGCNPVPSVAEASRPARLPGIAVAPNPVRSYLVVDYFLPDRGDLQLQILDPAGRVRATATTTLAGPGTGRYLWHLGPNLGPENGIYFLVVSTKGLFTVRKFVRVS